MQVKSRSEQLFFTTVRIDTTTNDGRPGSGTGFFFGYRPADSNVNYPFIVTNKHVVDGMRDGALTLS